MDAFLYVSLLHFKRVHGAEKRYTLLEKIDSTPGLDPSKIGPTVRQNKGFTYNPGLPSCSGKDITPIEYPNLLRPRRTPRYPTRKTERGWEVFNSVPPSLVVVNTQDSPKASQQQRLDRIMKNEIKGGA
ncbi:uncharacterized protein EDB91DRAFT_1083588 [Suillus paluster]|uniref:uncharacterized protein n=1 Tax=Suillus paluster TaxID=48578 RepID=UPI001B865A7C|nr:uncharacterized protein EDB91DRAFT_1083588 [Suillus paluster]KAG1735672.1 hypothetical protein EDB91DRAFT_1083588 [Suillus paluster]